MPPSQTAAAPAGYAWLMDVLFSAGSTVTWAAAGELPAGFRVADRLAVLPAGPGRSFIVSLADRHGTSSALTSYNALRSPRKRIARRVLGIGLRAGLAQPLLASKIDVGTAAGATPDQLGGALLTEHLSRLFGRGPVVIAVGSGGGPYRKPVLQVFGTGGKPLGYVKVGWNHWTRDAVCREAAALSACAAHPMRLGVPALLDHSQWRGLELLVTAPLPPGVRRLGASARLPWADVLREVSGLSQISVSELSTSTWWSGLRARILNGVADPTSRARLGRAAESIQRSHGHTSLEFGTWHGDLVPWNIAQLGSRLYAWDWESSAPEAPVGFDALHFYFQVAFVARRSSLETAAAFADHSARTALAGIGAAPNIHGLIATLHLVELAVRHEEARSSTGDVDDRFYPAVMDVLEQALAFPRDAAPLQSADWPS